MHYVLDTSVFIEAKDTYYMFNTCPGFWDWIIVQNKKGVVYSIPAVRDELQKGQDELSQWATARGDEFFLPSTASTESALSEVNNKMLNMDYGEDAMDVFRRSADYYIVAKAYARNDVVVTREIPSNSKIRIKIPTICDKLEIPCMNTFEMLDKEKARFVLDHS